MVREAGLSVFCHWDFRPMIQFEFMRLVKNKKPSNNDGLKFLNLKGLSSFYSAGL